MGFGPIDESSNLSGSTMIYIDSPVFKNYSHMIADSVEELHEFAEKMGIERCRFSSKRGKNQFSQNSQLLQFLQLSQCLQYLQCSQSSSQS